MERGRIVVDSHLQVPGYPGVWALGDCAWVPEAHSGQPCPPTAQHATRQAACVGQNIAAELTGGQQRVFAFKALGKLASLGHHSAVAEVMGVRLSGFLAWLLWRTIYLMKMPGFDRKLRVASDWALALILRPYIVQMKTAREAGMGRQHYEAKETIFRQGDRGDRVYVIVDGEVEVVRESDAGCNLLARLGPGEWFGEMSLVSDNPRNATARSVGPVNVLTIDEAAFNALFSHLPPLRSMFQRLIEQRTAESLAARRPVRKDP
jgi:NADH dehydrogenase